MTPIAVVKHARRELGVLMTPGPRMIDEIECVCSILLAILLAHMLGARQVAWAAFTGFVLMRSHAFETLVRGMLRIIGTMAGAALALIILSTAMPSLLMVTGASAAFGAIGLYGMLTRKRAYAWLLFGITFEMVLLGKFEHPEIAALEFAQTRLLEVAAGTAACVVVSLATTVTARRRWPGTPAASTEQIGWHPHAACHAAQTGLALALLPSLHVLFGLGELEQSAVTIMAVMVVPVSELGASGLVTVSRRLQHRTVGCVGGSLLATLVLLVASGSAAVLIVGTCVGVIVGRHLENGGTRIAYVGLQFTLAVLVVLVPDNYADATIAPALLRLASILIGMALLAPVLIVWHLFVRASWTHGSTLTQDRE